MPITFDTTGFQQLDQNTWLHGGNDRLALHVYDGAPDLPAGLTDLTRLRHDLAVRYSATGCLVEAQVVQLGEVPALLQIVKMPLANRTGQAFGCSVTVQGARSHAVLSLVAEERGTTGMREGVLAAEIGSPHWVLPHPYAPQLQSRLPFHAGDDPRFDSRFPDHPLSRVRRLMQQIVRTARVDPAFVAAASPQPQDLPPEVAEIFDAEFTTAVCGVPVAGHIVLQLGERTTYWKMVGTGLHDRLGRGNMARCPLGAGRFRDLISIDVRSGVAMIQDRFRTDGKSLGVTTHLQPVTKEEAYAAVTDEALREAYRWVGRMIEIADGRSEYLTLEPIVNQAELVEPYAMLALQQEDGKEIVHVFCAPAPSEKTPFNGHAGVSTAFSPEAVRSMGEIAMQAMLEWGPHPLEMAITFNRYAGTAEAAGTPESLTDETRALFTGQLAVATPGLAVGGYVALQQGEQRTYWRLPDDGLPAKLAFGGLARVHSPGHRFRDVVLIDQQSGDLLIPHRYSDDGSTSGYKISVVQVSAEEAMAAATPEACHAAFQRLGRSVYMAAKRSEFIYVEMLENELKQDPYLLLGVPGFFDENPVAVASASPAPSANTQFNGLPTLEAPGTPESVVGLGSLALQAITDWGVHPLHVVPTYHRPLR